PLGHFVRLRSVAIVSPAAAALVQPSLFSKLRGNDEFPNQPGTCRCYRRSRPTRGGAIDADVSAASPATGPSDRRPAGSPETSADRAVLPGPLHLGGRARPGKDTDDRQHRPAPLTPVSADSVHTRLDAVGHHRDGNPR